MEEGSSMYKWLPSLLAAMLIPYVLVHVRPLHDGTTLPLDLLSMATLGLASAATLVITILSRSILVTVVTLLPLVMTVTKTLLYLVGGAFIAEVGVRLGELHGLAEGAEHSYYIAAICVAPIPVCTALSIYYVITKTERSHTVLNNMLALRTYIKHSLDVLPPILLISSLIAYALSIALDTEGEVSVLMAFNTALALLALPAAASILGRSPISMGALSLMLALSPFNAGPMLALLSIIAPQMSRVLTLSSLDEAVELGTVKAVLERAPPTPTRLRLGASESKTMRWWWQAVPQGIGVKLDLTSLPNPHIVINGSSGTGKSFAASKLALRLARAYGISLLVIDPHGEYMQHLGELSDILYLDASRGVVNPFYLLGSPPSVRARQIVELVRSVYKIGPLQARMLEEAITSAYADKGIVDDDPSTWELEPPSVDDVIRALVRTYAREISSAESLVQYMAELRPIMATRVTPSDLVNHNVVIDLSRLSSRFLQAVVGDTVMRMLMYELTKMGFARSPRKLLVVDEAHIFVSKGGVTRSALEQAVAEMRKYGLIVVVVSQSPKELGDIVMANAATKLFLAIYEPQAANYVAEILSPAAVEDKREAIKLALSKLRRGEALLKTAHLDEPLLVELT